MKAAIPLARSLSHAVVSPTSRIPHLQWHFIQNARARQARNSRFAQQFSTSSCTRSSLTLDAWSSYHDEAQSVREDEGIAVNSTTTKQTEAELFEDVASELLAEACSERMLFWLTSTTLGKKFSIFAEDAVFERFFAAIEPADKFEHFKQNQRFQFGMRVLDNDDHLYFQRSVVRRMRSFIDAMSLVLDRRRQKRDLTIPICQHALQCVAVVGDAKTAQRIWQVLMPAGHEPNLECYNAYMHAFAWNLAYSEQARVNYRMWAENIRQRGLKWRRKGFQGYDISRINSDSTTTLKGKFLSIFKELTGKGLVTNETTFANMITGFGKAAELNAAESILRSVWNIDVASLQVYDEEELPSPTYYPDDHPLRPTQKLLKAIVHAYCINNQVEKALFVLDYTSRNYALEIPANLWEDFLEWAHVLSTKRGLSRHRQGQNEGKIHFKKVEEYYNKIVDVPHSVQPTAYMLLVLARSFRQRRLLDRTLETLDQVRRDLNEKLERLQNMIVTLEEIARTFINHLDNNMLSADVVNLRREFQTDYSAAMGTYGALHRHVQQVLTEDDWPGSGKETTWCRRRLPQIMEQFDEYCPLVFEYKTDTGNVKLYDRSQDRKEVAHSWEVSQLPDLTRMGRTRRLLAEATIVWHALEPDDLLQTKERLKVLPERLDVARTPRPAIIFYGAEKMGTPKITKYT